MKFICKNDFNHGLSEKSLNEIAAILLPYSKKIEKVSLFGSRAKGDYKEYSDIDMVIYGDLCDKEINRIHTLFDDSLLPYPVDVVAYGLIKNSKLKEHIDQFAASLLLVDKSS